MTEQLLIDSLVQGIVRSPLQRNSVHTSDAEIIAMPGQEGIALAVTTDAIVEEIASGLYADPALAGWMVVMASMSDLAAVGAMPLGMLIVQTLPGEMEQHDVASLHDGIKRGLAACSTYLLGGDTNIGGAMALAGTALGIVSQGEPLSRVGGRPGDLLYASGPLGAGNGYAAALFGGARAPAFCPRARLQEGAALRGIASSCMDTSDGALATLDQLVRLNSVGFRIAEGWEEILDRDAWKVMHTVSLPSWLLLAGCHGEFELLFTVPPEREPDLHAAAAAIDWQPRRLGTVTAEPAVTLPLHGTVVELDTGKIRGLWDEARGDVQAYLATLMDMDARLQGHSCAKDAVYP